MAISWTTESIDQLVYAVRGACIRVHKHIGPGLLEKVYCDCLRIEFDFLGISYIREMPITIIYRDQPIETTFRCDFLIENILILEVKAVSDFASVHIAQAINYINTTKAYKGLLVNFNCTNIISNGSKLLIGNRFNELNSEQF
jgi:GxxExxY protein